MDHFIFWYPYCLGVCMLSFFWRCTLNAPTFAYSSAGGSMICRGHWSGELCPCARISRPFACYRVHDSMNGTCNEIVARDPSVGTPRCLQCYPISCRRTLGSFHPFLERACCPCRKIGWGSSISCLPPFFQMGHFCSWRHELYARSHASWKRNDLTLDRRI